MAKKTVAYDENAIQTLDPLAHIRLRTGMYIGRLGDGSHAEDGIYVMLKEVIDNSVDEFIMGEGKVIEITRDGASIEVRDHGRGIPLGKVIDCVSKINTGGKYNDDVFQFSVGLIGVGTKAVNALSSEFEVHSWREGKYRGARFARGKLLKDDQGKDDKAPHGTLVRFTPDPEIFGRYEWAEEFIAARLRYYAHLNTGLTLRYNGESFKSKEGLKDLLASELGEARQEYETAHARVDRLEIAFTHVNVYGENVLSFVNGQHTKDGGTHLSAFREGLVKGVNEFAKASFAGEDVRDGLLAAIAVKIQDPVFESQTKNKLGSTDVRAWILQEVRNGVLVWLHKHPEPAAKLLEKIKNNERVRKELSAIKKDVRERERATAIRIPKLTDCRAHLSDASGKHREQSTLFLTEGDSAGGGMVPARDVNTFSPSRIFKPT